MKRLHKYLFVFFVPLIIFFIAAALNDFFPIGKMVYNIYDSSVQYPGFFEELKNFSFFSLHGALGFNLYGTSTYYLFSPLNLLYFFFNMVDFSIFYALLIYLKIGISSVTMFIFLKNESKSDNIWQMIFAIIYSLCGFTSAYYYNTMWMDGVYLLPLVLLGLNKLIKDDKKLLYLITLSLSIIINYYIGYMICIFSVIYFIYKVIDEDKKKEELKKCIKNFLTVSFFAAIISAFVLIPTFFALLQGKSSVYGTDFINYWSLNSNIKAFFYNLTAASYQLGDHSYGPALIYSSLLATVSFILFFFNKNFSKKVKITVLTIVLFYFIGFAFNLIDYAWQFFQKPVWWQSRYSFTLSAFLIIIGYKSMINLEGLQISFKKKSVVMICFITLISISAILVIKDTAFYKSMAVVFVSISIIFIFEYFIIIDNKKLTGLIIMMVVLELFLNTFNNLKKNNTNSELSFTQKVREIRQESVVKTKEYDSGLYRMEFVHKHSSNDSMLFNYNGVTMFNSVRNQDFIDLAEYYLNIRVDSNCGIYLDNFNPYILSLFNIKYILDYEHSYYEQVVDNYSYSSFVNPYPLSVGYIINEQILNIKLTENEYSENLNKIFSAMIGEEIDIFVTVNGNFTPDRDLLFVKKDNPGIVEIFTEGIQGGISESSDLLKAGVNYSINGVARVVDLDVYEMVMTKLSKNLLEVSQSSGEVFTGNIKANEDNQLLFISIPYDEGFKIKLNGEIVEPLLILDTFIGINLNVGDNEIEISYVSKGFKSGVLISSIGILASAIYLYKTKKSMI